MVHQSVGRCDIPLKVKVRVDVPDDLPLVSVDPLQMSQVFLNLITNAVQAMPDGGVLDIGAGAEAGKFPSSGGSLREVVSIRVGDTGEGITPENMKKLFQPLFTTKPKGVGLGLVVCKNLVEGNGGEITASSRPQEGTAFTITLPACEDEK
jgi:signal transduction histidine kinase